MASLLPLGYLTPTSGSLFAPSSSSSSSKSKVVPASSPFRSFVSHLHGWHRDIPSHSQGKMRRPPLRGHSMRAATNSSSPLRTDSPRDERSGGMSFATKERTSKRRDIFVSLLLGFLAGGFSHLSGKELAMASEFADMPALRGKDYGKSKMRYPDYTETKSGLQYKDLRMGSGATPKMGETVVVDWDGYTVGYYGRIFEARNKTKGGSFEGDDKDFFRFRLGSNQVIPAFEEAVVGMASGGIRRIIVPPELGYPDNDFNKLGPKPTTFSGQRALDFVLKNQGLIDKTLLFDVELLKILPS